MEQTGQVVLVVDDDEHVLRLAEAILRCAGYSVIAVPGPLQALNESRIFQDEISLLLTDAFMTEMDGLTLSEWVAAIHPNIRVLLMSGSTAPPADLPHLTKPFRTGQLLGEVAKAINDPQPFARPRSHVVPGRREPAVNEGATC